MNIFQAYKISKEIKNSNNTPSYEGTESALKTIINLQTKRYSITVCRTFAEYVLADNFTPYELFAKYTFAAHNQKTYRHIASRGMFARVFFNKLYDIKEKK